MKLTTPTKPADKAESWDANPMRVITMMLVAFAVVAAAIIALG